MATRSKAFDAGTLLKQLRNHRQNCDRMIDELEAWQSQPKKPGEETDRPEVQAIGQSSESKQRSRQQAARRNRKEQAS